MRDIPEKKDNTTDELALNEWGSIKNEWQNIISKAGLQFDENDEHQLTKAIKILSGSGDNIINFSLDTSNIPWSFVNLDIPSFAGVLPPKNLLLRLKTRLKFDGLNLTDLSQSLTDRDLKVTINASKPIDIVTPFHRFPPNDKNPYFPNSPYIYDTDRATSNNTYNPPYNLFYDEAYFKYKSVFDTSDTPSFPVNTLCMDFPLIWWEAKVTNKLVNGVYDPTQLILLMYPLEPIWKNKVPFFLEGIAESDTVFGDPEIAAVISIPPSQEGLINPVQTLNPISFFNFPNDILVYAHEQMTFPKIKPSSQMLKVAFLSYPDQGTFLNARIGGNPSNRIYNMFGTHNDFGNTFKTGGYFIFRHIPGYSSILNNKDGYFVVQPLLSKNNIFTN